MFTGILDPPYGASAAIVKNRFVKLSGNQTVAQAAASTDRSIGVANVDISAAEATAGKTTAVHVLGAPFVEAAAAISQGARVMSDAAGKATTATGAGNVPLGIALKAAAANGDLIPVLLTPGLPVI